MKSITRRTLIQLGLSPRYNGFNAIVEAIDMIAKEPGIKMMAVYTIAASRLNSTPYRIERNIRHATIVIVQRGDVELLKKICGNNVLADDHIAVGDFLHCLAMYIKEVHDNG